MKSYKDDGPDAEKYTIKMNGCHSCPIHCYSDMRIPGSAEHGGFEITGNTCVPNFPYLYMIGILGENAERREELERVWRYLGPRPSAPPWTVWACGATTHSSTATSRTALPRASSERVHARGRIQYVRLGRFQER